ncbi:MULTISPECIES: hypothetical protein [Nocardiopsidaceae]|uniref:WYL domain-containing protein n=1 Tax=Streptomonospora nanhaiensis TaxID=1323731 RepID=A0ABY6YFU0_9ACTN|nr:hypothetical protein [Streptomonospora nanhaiensis]WAE71137.1 hypothetical protein OUQ99_18070 [Streptomonospora nanhaiensis]
MREDPAPGWHIETATVNDRPAVSFRRPWEDTPTVLSATDPDRVTADLRALEEIDRTHPGWYVGFLIRTTPVSHLDGLWAQYPSVTVVHAETPPDLIRRITDARARHGL